MPLFDTAAQLIRALGQTVKPGEEQGYLNRSANVLALSVVLAHTFQDGNGRTARTLAHAVREGSEVHDSQSPHLQWPNSPAYRSHRCLILDL